MDKKNELRKLGFSLALGLNILGAIIFFRGREHFIFFSSIGSIFLIITLIEPMLLGHIKEILDIIIKILANVVNYISLFIIFYLIFTPISVFLRIFRQDMLNTKIEKDKKSYWIEARQKEYPPEFYRRMG